MRIVAYLYTDPLLDPQPETDLGDWDIDRTYQDLAVALDGQSPVRPQWQQLLADAHLETIDYLLIRRLEDLGDSLPEVGDRLAQVEALSIRLIAIESATLAQTEAEAIQVSDIQVDLLKLLQQVQQAQRSRRIRQGHARNRVQALPPPGKAPYGYRRGKNGYVLDRTTAPVVKEFFEHFLLYGSVRGAVRFIAKKYSKRIAVSTGHRWLTSSVYRGDLEYQNGDVVSDTHVAIVSRDEAAQVDRLLRRNRRLPPRTASAPRSLAGLVICQACQSPLTVARVSAPRQTQEYLYLRPSQCPHKPKCKALAYEQVLQKTIATVCEALPRAVAGVAMPDMDGVKHRIEATIAAKQSILNQLPDLVTSGILDQDTANLRAYKLRTEMAELQAKLAQLPPVNLRAIAQAVSIPQFWLDLSEAERRFYFREFIQRIEVDRASEMWNLQLVFIF